MTNKNLKSKMYIFSLFMLIFIIGCGPEIVDPDIKPIDKDLQATQELKKFSSTEEIRDFLNNRAVGQAGTIGFFGGRTVGIASDFAIAESAVAAPAAKTTAGTTATEYSETNIQVEGVDEADFVKNDGKYIYILTQEKLVIVDAFPAEDAEILSETKISGRPVNMFVNEDRLVVFTEDFNEVFILPQYDYLPRPRRALATHVLIYDISDKEDPELVNDYNVNGNYFESRMIGDHVYFIVKDNVYFYNQIIDVPVIRKSATVVIKPEIFYFDNPENSYVFHTIASFDIFDDDDLNAKTFMMGHSNNLYVSQNNIYITYQKNFPYRYYRTNNEDRFYDVVVPLLSSNVRSKILDVKDDNSLDSYEKWDKISAILEEMYNEMDKNEKNDLIDEIEEAIKEYEIKLEQERRKTVIHKINIDDGKIDYDTRGEVSGYLLNQFSMDEYDGNLRVATTFNAWTRRESVLYNNVYVLDDDLDIIGEIEAIAPDERIFSTRFIGDRLYMVTFKRIDPLFVIDLSDPRNPEILGELKIPGFSDYLHPYDEDHIIGVGKETGTSQWGGVSIKGVKLALFDVSDVENPKEIDKYEIGDSGTDSEALREHKAFLFDKEKNILVIPVREVKGNRYYDSRYGYYRQRIWQGAYVFGLTPEDGFELKGRITHTEGEEDNRYYYGSPTAVRRSLYMDDVLYTVSGVKIKMNDIDDIDEEINEVDLPYESFRYPTPYPQPVRATAPSIGIEAIEETPILID